MQPYRIAVCEDEAPIREQLSGLCCSILSEWGVEGAVTCFASADDLREALEPGPDAFDLFLLDIRMEGTSGLDLARWLYRQGVRERVIFVTGAAEYAVEGYRTHPLHYLLKPVERPALAEALWLGWERHRPRTVLFRQDGRDVALPTEEILYLEGRNHGVEIHLAGETQSFPISLAEAEALLPAGFFSRCHKSFLVNLAAVEDIGGGELLLRGGERLPVSRAFYRSFQSDLVRYVNRSGGR